MSWNYSGDPSSSDRDEIRFLIGDTDSSTQLITDEEIAYIVTMFPKQVGYPNYKAAAEAARTVAAGYTKAVTKQVGSLRLSMAERASQYNELAASLDQRASTGAGAVIGAPILGGGGPTYLGGQEWFSVHPR